MRGRGYARNVGKGGRAMKKFLFIVMFLLVSVSVRAETVTIELTTDQYSILSQYAMANSVDVDDYIHDIVSSWADSHIRGFYIDSIKKASTQDLKQKFGPATIKDGAK